MCDSFLQALYKMTILIYTLDYLSLSQNYVITGTYKKDLSSTNQGRY